MFVPFPEKGTASWPDWRGGRGWRAGWPGCCSTSTCIWPLLSGTTILKFFSPVPILSICMAYCTMVTCTCCASYCTLVCLSLMYLLCILLYLLLKGTFKLKFTFFTMYISSRAFSKTRHVGRMWNFNPEKTINSRKVSPPVSRKCDPVSWNFDSASQKCDPVVWKYDSLSWKCYPVARNCFLVFWKFDLVSQIYYKLYDKNV